MLYFSFIIARHVLFLFFFFSLQFVKSLRSGCKISAEFPEVGTSVLLFCMDFVLTLAKLNRIRKINIFSSAVQ